MHYSVGTICQAMAPDRYRMWKSNESSLKIYWSVSESW